MHNPSCRLMISDAVVDANLGDETILLNVDSGIYFGLDPVGTRIWELLVAGTSEQEIVNQVLAEYEAEPVQAQEDVKAFIQALAAKGLTQEVRG